MASTETTAMSKSTAGPSAGTKLPSRNLCFGIELEIIIAMPDSFKLKTGKTKSGKPVPSDWYQAARYILGRYKIWIEKKVEAAPLPKKRTVDKIFWPMRPDKEFLQDGPDLRGWRDLLEDDLLEDDPSLVDSDKREIWEDPKNADGLDFHAWTLSADPTIMKSDKGCPSTLRPVCVLRFG
jgi:hypothetical protein